MRKAEMEEPRNTSRQEADRINLEVSDPAEVGKTLRSYVTTLTESLQFSSEAIQSKSKLPSPTKLAQLVEKKSDAPELRLNVSSWGPRSSVSISSATEYSPESKSRQTQLAVLLEAAARHLLVAENYNQQSNPLSKLAGLRAKTMSNRFLKGAEQLINDRETPNKKRQLSELVTLLGFALAACSSSVTPPEDNENQPVATLVSDEQSPTAELTATAEQVGVATPESLSRQEGVLAEAGYTISETANGIALVNQEGDPVLESTEAATITITTREGETLIYPQEAFEAMATIGAGVERILTVKSPEGEVEYFFLDKTEEWVTPLEIQTDPREIENYPEVNIEDIWNGRALYSELLKAEPFPEGTWNPDLFVYWLHKSGGSLNYTVRLQDYARPGFEALDTGQEYLRDLIHKDNDYRRWTNYYRSQTPEGVEVIVGVEQILATDGESSLFFHYVFGPEWPWPNDYVFPSGNKLNVIDNVFLAKDVQYNYATDQRSGVLIRPIISFEYSDPQWEGKGITVLPGTNNPESAAENLYITLEQNDPLSARDDLKQKIEDAAQIQGSSVYVDAAGSELNEFQYMGLIATFNSGIFPEYFE